MRLLGVTFFAGVSTRILSSVVLDLLRSLRAESCDYFAASVKDARLGAYVLVRTYLRYTPYIHTYPKKVSPHSPGCVPRRSGPEQISPKLRFWKEWVGLWGFDPREGHPEVETSRGSRIRDADESLRFELARADRKRTLQADPPILYYSIT